MKKLLTLLIGLFLVASVLSFAACGSEADPPAAPAENGDDAAPAAADDEAEAPAEPAADDLTLRVSFMGEGRHIEDVRHVFDLYTERTGVEIEFVFVPVGGSGWADFFTNLQLMFVAGDSPDTAMVAIEGIAMFAERGLALPLNDFLDRNPGIYEEAMADIHPRLQAPFVIDGNIYAFVCEWNNVVVHFNMDLLEAAGLELPGEDWTKEDFIYYAERLTINDGTTRQFAFHVPNYYFGMNAFLFSNDAAILNEDMTASVLHEPNSVEMFQFLQDAIHVHGWAPVPEPGTDAIQMLIDGQIAMGFWGRWPTSAYIENDFHNVAVQLIPTFRTKATIFGSGGHLVLSGTQDYDAAAAFAIWTAEAEFVEEFYGVGSIPTRRSVAERIIPALGLPLNYDVYFRSADFAMPVQSPPEYAEIANVLDRYMSSIFTNEMTVQEALNAATAEIDFIFQSE